MSELFKYLFGEFLAISAIKIEICYCLGGVHRNRDVAKGKERGRQCFFYKIKTFESIKKDTELFKKNLNQLKWEKNVKGQPLPLDHKSRPGL